MGPAVCRIDILDIIFPHVVDLEQRWDGSGLRLIVVGTE